MLSLVNNDFDYRYDLTNSFIREVSFFLCQRVGLEFLWKILEKEQNMSDGTLRYTANCPARVPLSLRTTLIYDQYTQPYARAAMRLFALRPQIRAAQIRADRSELRETCRFLLLYACKHRAAIQAADLDLVPHLVVACGCIWFVGVVVPAFGETRLA